jgi:hypothetical protein
MPAGAFAVHQLRYWLAFGSRASALLRVQGHSYLHSAAPWIVVLVAFTLGVFLRALGRAFRGNRSAARFTASFAALWLMCALALVGTYVLQEFLEGLFVTGHPSGLVGIFGYGGWWSIPAAFAVGLVLAALFHGARWVLDEVARRWGQMTHRPERVASRVRPREAVRLRLAPLAAGESGRGPPR